MRKEISWRPPMVSVVTLLALVLCPAGLGAQSAEPPKGNPEGSSSEKSVHDDLGTGGELTSEQAASLEEKLAGDPNDMALRTQLLGYYGGVRALRDDSAKAAKLQHVLWFIRNAADSEVLGRPQARIQRIRTSIELLKRAQALDPSNPKWPKELGHTYGSAAHRGAGGPDQKSSEMELEQLEKAYALSGESGRDSLLEDLAKAAFAADQIEKARQYSQLMLQNMEAGWNYGNRVHHGHLVLGRIALREGNIEEAKSRLIAAGKTPGSPQLNSFGPNMLLAKALLEIGERAIVLEYFELCSKFWKRHHGRLDEWGSLAAAGRTPDFRANLDY